MSRISGVLTTLNEYALARSRDVARGLETPAYSVLVLEKYAVGMVDALRMLGVSHSDCQEVQALSDRLCQALCPEHQELRKLRYQRVADLDLTTPRGQRHGSTNQEAAGSIEHGEIHENPIA